MNKRFFFWSVIWFNLKQTKIDYLKPMTMTCYLFFFFLLDRGKQSSLLQAEFIFTDIYLLWRCMNDSLFCYM